MAFRGQPQSPMPLPLAVQVLTMALALLCFNIAGVYITKLQSATHRACVDATRQAVVWMHALLVGWEEFSLVERDVESTARCGRPVRPNRLIGRGSPRLAEARRGSGQPHEAVLAHIQPELWCRWTTPPESPLAAG